MGITSFAGTLAQTLGNVNNRASDYSGLKDRSYIKDS
jgi:hypothetical protein